MLYHSLNRNNDFRRIYAKGKVRTSSVLVTYAGKNRRQQTRVGITVSKKIGKAVRRNRARRIIREAYRLLGCPAKKGTDLVFVARGKTPYLKTTDILPVMRRQLEDLGIVEK